MANIDFRDIGNDIDAMRRRARHAGHVRRAQAMLVAAGLATCGVVAVAAVLLTNVI